MTGSVSSVGLRTASEAPQEGPRPINVPDLLAHILENLPPFLPEVPTLKQRCLLVLFKDELEGGTQQILRRFFASSVFKEADQLDLEQAVKLGCLPLITLQCALNKTDKPAHSLIAAGRGGYDQQVKEILSSEKAKAIPAHGWLSLSGILGEAAEMGRVDVVHEILQFPSIRIILVDGGEALDSALELAAEKGHVEVVRELLQFSRTGTIPAGREIRLGRALRMAGRYGHVEVVREILQFSDISENPADGEFGLRGALDVAAGYGHVEVVREILQYPGASTIPVEGDYGLDRMRRMAIACYRMEIAKLLKGVITARARENRGFYANIFYGGLERLFKFCR